MSQNLIQRWLDSGDPSVAEALYQAHHVRVYRLAYGLLSDRQEAEEVMQDTMAYALAHIDRYNPQRTAFTTWLHTVVVDRCRDRYRDRYRDRGRRVPLGGWRQDGGDVDALATGPGGQAVAQKNWDGLDQALDRLRPKLREAIVLRYWGGHTYREMAHILDCPLSTAQSRVCLAYERLRDLLSPAGVSALGGENPR